MVYADTVGMFIIIIIIVIIYSIYNKWIIVAGLGTLSARDFMYKLV